MTTPELLARLGAADPGLRAVSDLNGEVRLAEPPWWPGVQVIDVIVYLPHKPVRFRYAVNATRVVPLGSSAALYQVNAMTGLQLEQSRVAPYLRFFIDSSEYNALQVVERPDEPLWFESAATDPAEASLKAAALALIHPIIATPQGDGYHCVLSAIDYRRLLTVVFEVTRDGHVTEVSRSVLMEALPVPYVGV